VILEINLLNIFIMFGKNKKTSVKEIKVVTNAASLSQDIDSAIKSFTTLITKLTNKAAEANEMKQAKEAEIKALTVECDALQAVSDRANDLATKISNIFN
jgi:ABC-type transporter Mla subunit MlaD